MHLAVKRLVRAVTITAAIVASSGSLEATDQPLLAGLGRVVFSLTAVFSEREEARRKIAEALAVATTERLGTALRLAGS